VPLFDFTAGLASNPQLAPYSGMVALAGASQCGTLADTSGLLFSAEEGASTISGASAPVALVPRRRARRPRRTTTSSQMENLAWIMGGGRARLTV
jgi:hypothetical protein